MGPNDSVGNGPEVLDQGAEGNRLVGGMAKSLLEHLACSIVEEPDAVVVEAVERPGAVELHLSVAPQDMGRVIGRKGRVAQALRTLVRVAGSLEGIETSVDIVD